MQKDLKGDAVMRYSNDTFKQKLALIHPNITPLEEYSGHNVKIRCMCEIDGYTWSATPAMLLFGTNCPKCSGVAGLSSEEMNSVLTQKKFSVRSIATDYVSAVKPSKFICTRCGHKWDETFCTIRKRTMFDCPKCKMVANFNAFASKYNIPDSILPIVDQETYIDALNVQNSYLRPLENISSINTGMLHICTLHNVKTTVAPTKALIGQGCAICKKEKIGRFHSMTHSTYLYKLRKYTSNIDVLEEYKDSRTKILHVCNVCGNEWMVKPNSILSGNGCPKCAFSKGERKITEVLSSLHTSYIPQYKFADCRNKVPLSFDFYLPELNTLIEYQGQQHYEPVDFGGMGKKRSITKYEENCQRDQIKRDYALNNKISLIEIPYWEYDNIDSILLRVIQDVS